MNHARPYPSNNAYGGNGNLNAGYAPPPPRAALNPPSSYGKKKALLCGINYQGKKYALQGSINDAKNMKSLLIECLGFRSENILLLTDDEMDPFKIPTKQNIRKALRWLVQGCQSGDSLLFHFSGHASRQKDYSGDEVDGFDEALCPLDHETEGNIIDDELNSTIIRPLPQGVTLHAIMDACFSGTMLDLPLLCRVNREGFFMWEDHSSTVYKGTRGGLAIGISACDDHQTSADTTAFTKTKARSGALTFSFIQAVRNEPGLTYGRLLNSMRSAIHEAHNGRRLNSSIATLVNRFRAPKQEPQISSTEPFDIHSRKFVI